MKGAEMIDSTDDSALWLTEGEGEEIEDRSALSTVQDSADPSSISSPSPSPSLLLFILCTWHHNDWLAGKNIILQQRNLVT